MTRGRRNQPSAALFLAMQEAQFVRGGWNAAAHSREGARTVHEDRARGPCTRTVHEDRARGPCTRTGRAVQSARPCAERGYPLSSDETGVGRTRGVRRARCASAQRDKCEDRQKQDLSAMVSRCKERRHEHDESVLQSESICSDRVGRAGQCAGTVDAELSSCEFRPNSSEYAARFNAARAISNVSFAVCVDCGNPLLRATLLHACNGCAKFAAALCTARSTRGRRRKRRHGA